MFDNLRSGATAATRPHRVAERGYRGMCRTVAEPQGEYRPFDDGGPGEAEGRVSDTGRAIDVVGSGSDDAGRALDVVGPGLADAGRAIDVVGSGSADAGRALDVVGSGSADAGSALDVVGPGLADAAGHLRDLLSILPASENARDLPIGSLDACFEHLGRLERAAAAIKARLVSCAAATRAHDAAGLTDTGAYLRDRLGVSGREAKKQTELSRSLAGMDGATEALADGTLGVEQATAMGRAARNGHLGSPEEVEAQLLGAAKGSSPEELERSIRRKEQAADADALRRGENRAHAMRRASLSQREDGVWSLYALLDPVAGAIVQKALRTHTYPDPKGTHPSDQRRSEQRTADGLVALAEAALSAGAPVAGGVRPHLSVVIVDDGAESGAVTGERVRVGPPGRTDSGVVISPEAVHRITCDSRVSRIVMTSSSQILDAGRATKTWSEPQRRGVVARDGQCRGPGCDRPPDWCHLHHVQFWRNGGRTDVRNALLLCVRHHRMVHEGGWTVTMDPTNARAVFVDPRGKEYVTLPRGALLVGD